MECREGWRIDSGYFPASPESLIPQVQNILFLSNKHAHSLSTEVRRTICQISVLQLLGSVVKDQDLRAEQTVGKWLILATKLLKIVKDLIFRGGRFIFHFLVTIKNKVIFIL